MEHIIFTLAEEEFGVRVDHVYEILKLPPINPLPQFPDYIEGVITVRKHSIAVMDLRKRLKLSKTQTSGENQVVVVRIGRFVLGLIVDHVKELLDLDGYLVDAAEKISKGYGENKLITGIAHVGERVVLLLDLDQLIETKKYEADINQANV